MLTVSLPQSRLSQLLSNSLHVVSAMYHSVTETAAFNSACATRTSEMLLTIEGIFIGFYIILL
jgi:hypothetical protein